MMRLQLLFALAWLCSAAAPTWAQTDQEITAERQRIGAERARVEAGFEAAKRGCYQRFAVNDCIADAQAERRQVLSDLRRQEINLNDLERRRRAADRLREQEEREAEQARRQAEKASQAQPPRETRQPAQPQPPRAAQAPRTPNRPEPVDTEENRRRHAERVQEAQERKAKAAQRAAERTDRAAPLPVPRD